MSPDKSRPVSAEVKFALLNGLRGVSEHSDVQRPVLFGDLLQYLHGNPSIDRDKIQHALRQDIGLANQYRDLLSQRRRLFAPKLVAAASSQATNERSGSGFRVLVRPSKADEQQCYVILEVAALAAVEDGAALTLHVLHNQDTAAVTFPGLHDGRSQVIVDRSDALLQLLAQGDAEISIL